MPGPGSFDANATPAGGLQPGDDITDAPTAGLFNVSQAVSSIPVTLKRGTGSLAGLATSTGAGLPQPGGDYAPPQVAPYESVLKMFYDLPNDARASLQQQMYEAGLYPDGYYSGKNQITPGSYDDDSFKVWSGVVQTAARAEKTPSEVLGDLIASRGRSGVTGGAGGGSGGSMRAPFSPVVTNPLDIRDTAQVVAKKTLGRQFSDAELDRFVSSFQGMETGAQSTNYNAAAAGGTTTAAPSMQTAAENAARTAAPAEAGAHDLASVYDMFTQLLGGGGTG